MSASAPPAPPPPQQPSNAANPQLSSPNTTSHSLIVSPNDFSSDYSDMDGAMDWEASDLEEAALLAASFDPAALLEDVAACSSDLWRVNALRDGQKRIAHRLLDPRTSKFVLGVAPTGSGKTHVVRCVGPMLGGVVLYFVPLLALSADILLKFRSADQSCGTVQAFNLDELCRNTYLRY